MRFIQLPDRFATGARIVEDDATQRSSSTGSSLIARRSGCCTECMLTNSATDATKTEETAAGADVEMKEAEAAPAEAPTETPNSKKNSRRKSVGGGLSRKGSKARLTHTDAKPGDHFLMKLKGFPPWPVIVCDESMLPPALTSSRPVSAAKADGTYSEAYADGGKRVHDRTFPVMYLFTNEL